MNGERTQKARTQEEPVNRSVFLVAAFLSARVLEFLSSFSLHAIRHVALESNDIVQGDDPNGRLICR